MQAAVVTSSSGHRPAEAHPCLWEKMKRQLIGNRTSALGTVAGGLWFGVRAPQAGVVVLGGGQKPAHALPCPLPSSHGTENLSRAGPEEGTRY